MADFLTHLVARSRELGPRLQRRVPSLFEPAGDAFGAHEIEAAPSRDAVGEAQPALPPHPASRPAAARLHDSEATAAEPDSTARTQVEPVRRAVEPIVIDVPRVVSRVAAVRPTEIRAEGAQAPDALQAHHDAPASVAAGPRPRAAAAEADARAASPIERVLLRETLLDRTVVVPPAPPRCAQLVTSDGAARVVAAAVGVRETVGRRTGRRQPALVQSVPEPSAPTISVTIGRVEVRASRPAAAPARARREAAPKLSLDDYLRRRSGRPDE